MAFPTSPTNGQKHTESGVTYIYVSSFGAWDIFDPNQDINAGEVLTKIKTVDGAGSGLDADTLDGVSSASLVRNDQNGTISGNLSVNGDINLDGNITVENNHYFNGKNAGYHYAPYLTGGVGTRSEIKSNANLLIHTDADGSGPTEWMKLQAGAGTPNELTILSKTSGQGQNANGLLYNGSKVWNASNDGSGSGLDADTVDGKHASELGGVTVGSSDPSGSNGDLFYHTSQNQLKIYYNGWKTVKAFKDGLSEATAGDSGYQLVTDNPGITSGTYWIKPGGSSPAIQMYVDATTDGGGYDFYWCTDCTATSYVTQSNGCPSGTSWVYARSRGHWSIMISRWGNRSSPNAGSVYKTGSGGNYTSQIMRNPTHYGSGSSAWRVPDGGKWWLRDTTHSEPNGDYTANGWLMTYSSQTAGSDIGFNDGGAYSTGTSYLCSTNAKP